MYGNNLKSRVMRRVYAIWLVRKVASPLGVKIMAPVALFSFFLYHISCFNVLKNAIASSASFHDVPKFFFNTFLTAEIIDQFLVAGLIALIVAFAWDLFKKGVPAMMLRSR